jgi:curved DNA-binding protein CbpA
MIAINRAWDVLGDAGKRATYDKGRVALSPRRTTAEPRPQPAPDTDGGLQPRPWTTQRSGTVLDFGRYAGWSFPEIARQDPDFLRWLARMPIGRPYAAEIERTLAMHRPPEQPSAPQVKPKGRFGR